MSGTAKAFSIWMVAFFIGVIGSSVVGWPAVACAAAAIFAIALSSGEK